MAASDEDLLTLLKTRGPLGTAAVATALGISPQGARQRLEALRRADLVESRSERAGVGRPRARWQLRAAARARFPDAHAELAVELIEGVRAAFGEAALERLVAAREAQQRARYAVALAGAQSLAERLERLAAARSREGYMAELQPDGEDWLFLEHHCPVCAAAASCLGFCRSELELFRALLGPEAAVERTAHLLEGAARCIYRVTPVRRGLRSGPSR